MAYRLFRLRNKGKTGWWVIALGPETAKEYSLKKGCARKIENITVVGDQTDYYLHTTRDGSGGGWHQPGYSTSLKKILCQERVGFAHIRMTPVKWDNLGHPIKTKGEWILV